MDHRVHWGGVIRVFCILKQEWVIAAFLELHDNIGEAGLLRTLEPFVQFLVVPLEDPLVVLGLHWAHLHPQDALNLRRDRVFDILFHTPQQIALQFFVQLLNSILEYKHALRAHVSGNTMILGVARAQSAPWMHQHWKTECLQSPR